jgi:hypothetical protein
MRINGQSTTTQKEILQYGFSGVGFLFTHFSQAFEDRHFTEREMFVRVGEVAGGTQAEQRVQMETHSCRVLLGGLRQSLLSRYLTISINRMISQRSLGDKSS